MHVGSQRTNQATRWQMTQAPIFQSLWIGERLSTLERLCLYSFIYHGHKFHLYTYDEVREVPEGVLVKDANRILPRDKIFKYKNHDSYAGFADLFRYKMLLENGGYWVDMDMVCLRPFTEQAPYLFSENRLRNLWHRQHSTHHPIKLPIAYDMLEYCSQRINSPKSRADITNNVIKSPAGSEIMQYCYEQATRRDPASLEWGDTGPKLISQAVRHFDFREHVVPSYLFCPVVWWQWHRLISGSWFVNWMVGKRLDSSSQCVHLWNEMWRRNGIDKDGDFPESCIYEQLKRKYLPPST